MQKEVGGKNMRPRGVPSVKGQLAAAVFTWLLQLHLHPEYQGSVQKQKLKLENWDWEVLWRDYSFLPKRNKMMNLREWKASSLHPHITPKSPNPSVNLSPQ